MPNGGPDCCANCGFNKAVHEMLDFKTDEQDKFHQLSWCMLQKVQTPNPFWTYCRNFRLHKLPISSEVNPEIKGLILAGGLYEGVTIPWNGDIGPEILKPCICVVCGRKTDKGITVEHEENEIGFCTDRHYVEWWKTVHDDPRFSADDYKEPDKY